MEWVNKPQKDLVDLDHACFIVWCSSQHTPPVCQGYVNHCPTDTSACKKGNML
ncbi:Uncharacterised protein [Clostridium putrefaciens]|uniref:Uncharacterized protein n=1 Tax=Clostridium putrefaciens TaxID=99675 RepID=A0A381JA63_9CLOT|nr:hypothetical protein [Clostridium putrefaciens]SUY48150.1 Uncharacterised protein [Clostridium putrefaciens]